MNEGRFLKMGEGFRADSGGLRLFVQVEEDGWTAGVYDIDAEQWVEKKKVNSAEQGKAWAAEIAASAMKVPNLKPNWIAL